MGEEEDVASPSARGTHRKSWKEVQVSVIPYNTSKDEWVFKDAMGRTTKTRRTEWELRQYVDGSHVWVWKGASNHRYFTCQRLLNPQ